MLLAVLSKLFPNKKLEVLCDFRFYGKNMHVLKNVDHLFENLFLVKIGGPGSLGSLKIIAALFANYRQLWIWIS